MPQTFGKSREEAPRAVDGVFTFAETGASWPARLLFRNGVLRQVLGFTGQPAPWPAWRSQGGLPAARRPGELKGAPREILPTAGDTFTIQERWLDLDVQESARLRCHLFGDKPCPCVLYAP